MAIKSARAIALEILFAVDKEEAFSNIALNKALEKYKPEKIDRAFITDIVYGTLRVLNTLDWILGQFLTKPLSKLNPWLRNILRMAVYQIVYMDKVPVSAACNEAVKLTRQIGQSGMTKMVNGVLRNVARNKEQLEYPDETKEPGLALSIRYSIPLWLAKRWIQEFGLEEAKKLCKASNTVPPNSIRTNTLKVTRDKLKEILLAEGVNADNGKFAPETLLIEGFKSIGSIKAHSEGLFMIQDESSTLVGHAVNPRPGTTVIDVCSAPGGKSTHLAQLMGNKGRIISIDVHPHKIDLIRENAVRLGISIIEPVVMDATHITDQYVDVADYVIVDAPCSGLGVLRRKPEIRWRKREELIQELSVLQLKILESAAKCVKSDGTLIYSTCTLAQEENLNVVNAFLRENTEFRFESLLPYLPKELTTFQGSETMKEGYIQILPHIHGLDGFFIARLRKKGR